MIDRRRKEMIRGNDNQIGRKEWQRRSRQRMKAYNGKTRTVKRRESMRALVITNIYPPQNLGGFGLCIERLAKGLDNKGYEIQILTSNQPHLGITENEHEIKKLKLLGKYDKGLYEYQTKKRKRKDTQYQR